jgi:hypothetical protein
MADLAPPGTQKLPMYRERLPLHRVSTNEMYIPVVAGPPGPRQKKMVHLSSKAKKVKAEFLAVMQRGSAFLSSMGLPKHLPYIFAATFYVPYDKLVVKSWPNSVNRFKQFDTGNLDKLMGDALADFLGKERDDLYYFDRLLSKRVTPESDPAGYIDVVLRLMCPVFEDTPTDQVLAMMPSPPTEWYG